jgi:hypothetical protein
MNIDDDTKRFIIYRLKWLGLYLGVGLVLVFLLPFPYDFVSVLGLFIMINFFRTRSMMKKIRWDWWIKRPVWFSLIFHVW